MENADEETAKLLSSKSGNYIFFKNIVYVH